MRKLLSLVVVVSLLLTFFSSQGCVKKQEDVIKIGAILPLTGPSSVLGELHKFGIDMAVDEINQKGGINNKKLEIIYEDSKNESKTGIAVFNKLLNAKVPAIISTFSNVSVPLASYMGTKNSGDLPVLLTTATSAPNITKLSPKVFRAFIISTVESKEIAKFLIKKGYKNVAVYYVEDDYGKGAEVVLKKEFENKNDGRRVVYSEGYNIGQTNHRTSITKMIAKNPEIIFIVGYDRDFASAIKQIKESGFKGDLVTTAPLSIPQNLKAAGNPNGIFLTASSYNTASTKELSEKFDLAFKKRYQKPSNYQSASTYLCVKLIAEAIKTNGYTSNSIKSGLLNIKDFPSPLGNITITENREGSFPVVIKKTENGKVVDIKTE